MKNLFCALISLVSLSSIYAQGVYPSIFSQQPLSVSPLTAGSTFTSSSILFVTTNGNDSTAIIGRQDRPFLTLSNAVLVAPTNSLIQLGYGSFDIGNTIFYLTNTTTIGGISLNGMGDGTVITGGINGKLCPRHDSTLSNFKCLLAIYISELNAAQTAFVPTRNVTLRNLNVQSQIDGIYFQGVTNLNAWDCSFVSGFDGVADWTDPDNTPGICTANFFNCYMAGVSNQFTTVGFCHGLSVSGAIVQMYGGGLYAKDGTNETAALCLGNVQTTTGGAVYLYNVGLDATNASGTGPVAKDILKQASSVEKVFIKGTAIHPNRITTGANVTYAPAVSGQSVYVTNTAFAPDFLIPYSATNVNAAYTLGLPLNVDTNKKLVQTTVMIVRTNGGGGTTPFLLTTPTGATGTGVPYLTNTIVVTVTAYGSDFTNYNYISIK